MITGTDFYSKWFPSTKYDYCVYIVTLHDILFSNVLKVVMIDNRAVAYCIVHDMKYLSSHNIDNVVSVFTYVLHHGQQAWQKAEPKMSRKSQSLKGASFIIPTKSRLNCYNFVFDKGQD